MANPSLFLSATAIAERIHTAVDTVTRVVTITETNDPNNLIGRPTGYTDAAVVYDKAVQCGERLGADCGAMIEVWPSAEHAQRRANYIAGLQTPARSLGLSTTTCTDQCYSGSPVT
ncbi:hypothetical protein [Nocardia sp. NPDC058497]|uniref:hypothetical protein n=1 Tax=Nocardia sp. NPDC058497 TaxID=3346529 RepID=UPI00364C50A9